MPQEVFGNIRCVIGSDVARLETVLVAGWIDQFLSTLLPSPVHFCHSNVVLVCALAQVQRQVSV